MLKLYAKKCRRLSPRSTPRWRKRTAAAKAARVQGRTFRGCRVRGARGDPRRGRGHENRGLARGPDARGGACLAVVLLRPLLLSAAEFLHEARGLVPRRTRRPSGGENQRLTVRGRHVGEQRAVGHDRFEERDADAHALERQRCRPRRQILQRHFRHGTPRGARIRRSRTQVQSSIVLTASRGTRGGVPVSAVICSRARQLVRSRTVARPSGLR